VSPEEQSVPQWAADLRVSVAEIRGRVEQIPEINTKLEELRANTVPMTEHLKVMADVEELKRRDLGERSDWEEMKGRVPLLWEERAEMRGSIRTLRWAVAGLTLLSTVVGGLVALHDLGLQVSVHP